jgi:FkbH-like protein
MGQVYSEFQTYLKEQSSVGVLLTINSKNDYENAILGLNHPDSILKPDDFVSIKANWLPKSENIVAIANELCILPESLIFVDDNLAEREIVRQNIKGVAIANICNPEDYILTLDRSGYFEVTSLTQDDFKRNSMYKANAKRNAQATLFTDYNEYLKSLEMVATIEDFLPIYVPRITQLTNKSNQFNLTTKRYTQDEMESVFFDNNYVKLYGKLSDKFGDNGIVSVVIGKVQGTTLHIELWLMSCRVLKRDFEYAMLNELVRVCKSRGIETIVGYYYKTAKNTMVKNLYGDFGFTLTSLEADESSTWLLDVDSFKEKQTYIAVNGQ